MYDEWTLASSDPNQKLARLHFFSVTREFPQGKVEFRITVHEYAGSDQDRALKFFARSDRSTDVGGTPYTPCGWGGTLLKALRECIQEIDRFPYEAEAQGGDSPSGGGS